LAVFLLTRRDFLVWIASAMSGPRNAILARIGNQMRIVGSPPVGRSGVAYSFTFTGVGGQAPYTWSIKPEGELAFWPPGISATNDTISGTTTGETETAFRVTLTDSVRNQISALYTLVFAAPATAVVFSGDPCLFNGVTVTFGS
jgi:hypothetical protein